MPVEIYGVTTSTVKKTPDNMCNYIRTLNDILTQLNTQKNKQIAMARISILRERIILHNPELR
jgi:hypothetical protein